MLGIETFVINSDSYPLMVLGKKGGFSTPRVEVGVYTIKTICGALGTSSSTMITTLPQFDTTILTP